MVIGDDGLILTIGYLITEASRSGSPPTRAHVRRRPCRSPTTRPPGFGLVQPLGRSACRRSRAAARLALGRASTWSWPADGGRAHALKATRVRASAQFAGYWEYVLDEALFTAPAHPHWGGAA